MFSLLLLVTVLFGVAAIVLLLAPLPPARHSLVARLPSQDMSNPVAHAQRPALEGPHAG